MSSCYNFNNYNKTGTFTNKAKVSGKMITTRSMKFFFIYFDTQLVRKCNGSKNNLLPEGFLKFSSILTAIQDLQFKSYCAIVFKMLFLIFLKIFI